MFAPSLVTNQNLEESDQTAENEFEVKTHDDSQNDGEAGTFVEMAQQKCQGTEPANHCTGVKAFFFPVFLEAQGLH